MSALGIVLARNLKLPAVLELVGDVGVGKTTLTRGLANGFGIDTEVTSPSFTISKRYALPDNSGELIHYDFYRLDDPGIMRSELREALENPHSVIVVEWGGDIADLLPENKIRLELSLNNDGSREVQQTGLSEELWKTCGKLVEKITQDVDKTHKKVEKTTKPVENSHKNSNVSAKSSAKQGSKTQNSPIRLYLDTSTDTCVLHLNKHEYTRVGKYDLAEQIFTFIHEKLGENHADWTDIAEITFFSGPGSFTGLRIGAALVNALADQLRVPLFDHHGQKHQIIIPEYGREANISAPRK